jgi:hypothetical protein
MENRQTKVYIGFAAKHHQRKRTDGRDSKGVTGIKILKNILVWNLE